MRRWDDDGAEDGGTVASYATGSGHGFQRGDVVRFTLGDSLGDEAVVIKATGTTLTTSTKWWRMRLWGPAVRAWRRLRG